MLTQTKLSKWIGMILVFGIIFSALFVLIGGTLFLVQNGQDIMPTLPPPDTQKISLLNVWAFAFSFTPLGIIQLGLLSMVSLQILRVGMLFGFYVKTRDYWFIAFSAFILLVLIYSTVWRS